MQHNTFEGEKPAEATAINAHLWRKPWKSCEKAAVTVVNGGRKLLPFPPRVSSLILNLVGYNQYWPVQLFLSK